FSVSDGSHATTNASPARTMSITDSTRPFGFRIAPQPCAPSPSASTFTVVSPCRNRTRSPPVRRRRPQVERSMITAGGVCPGPLVAAARGAQALGAAPLVVGVAAAILVGDEREWSDRARPAAVVDPDERQVRLRHVATRPRLHVLGLDATADLH